MGKLSAPSTITSQPSPRIRSTFSEVSRSRYGITSTSGLSASIVRFADSAFQSPSVCVEWAIWRCRFDSSTRSSSTIPSRPIARRGQVERRRRAEAARADQEHARVEQLQLPLLADLGDQQMAAVALALRRVERLRVLDLAAVALPVGEAARERADALVAELGRASSPRTPSERRRRSRGASGRVAVGRHLLDARLEVAARARGRRRGCGPRPTRRARARRRGAARPRRRGARAQRTASTSSISDFTCCSSSR